MSDKFEGQLRHILSALGGIAMFAGWLTQDDVDTATVVIMEIAGAIALAIAFVRSWITKNSGEEVIQKAVEKALEEKLAQTVMEAVGKAVSVQPIVRLKEGDEK